ncbi:MAG: baseplate J/gp47 family protein [Bacteroidota bacterium]
MNKYNNINVAVKRNGTTQRERLSDTLLPEYILVDERSREDLMHFIAEYAKNLRYFNLQNEEEGTWETFFSENPTEEEKQSPHIALLLTFLELFKLSQDHLNTFTKRHLDFYYKEVLQFTKDKAQPDHVHLIFELARSVSKHLLKAGTFFKAGKDAKGNDIHYQLAAATELGQAQVNELKTVFLKNSILEIDIEEEIDGETVPVKHSMEKTEGIYAGENLPADTITTFGHTALPAADIGFAIATPVLTMREGEREIKISIEGVFHGDEHWLDHLPAPEALQGALQLQFSGEKTWIDTTPDIFTIERSDDYKALTLTLEAKLHKDQPSIVPFNPKHLEGAFNTEWPMVRILLNPIETANPERSYPYHIIKHFIVIDIRVHVDVKEVKQLLLQNDFSELNPNKPFNAFGTEPGPGANFYIGSAEIFRKKLESLKLHLQWYNLPGADLGEYYQEYNIEENGQVQNPRNNDDFKVDINLLKDKEWISLGQGFSMFQSDARNSVTIDMTGGNIGIGGITDLDELAPYNIDSTGGFIRLTLQDTDFGHRVYPKLYAETITANINIANSNNSNPPGDPDVPELPLPNAPYNPVLKSVTLDYAAQTDPIKHENQLYHIHPFGRSSHTLIDNTPYLLPDYGGRGNLYIGIENLSPPCELSILFQVAEGTANPSVRKPTVLWSYLSGEKWFPMEGAMVLRDSTDSFNSPGIITFAIPEAADDQNQSIGAGKHWLRANVTGDSDGACILTDVRAQAATVVEVIDEANPSEINEPLAPGSIRKMQEKDSLVKNILQPYTSIHGKGTENDNAFYVRVSERLRHKQRALTAWDYERLVLERFPSLYKVQCYHHSSLEKGDTPGSILLIIIPDLRNNLAINPLQPMASLGLQEQVRAFLEKMAPPQNRIEVRNPVFETIQLRFLVKFREGFNKGYYEDQLQEELRRFLSPWAYSESEDINMGGKIYKSSLLNFVEERPYVDYATYFRMDQTDVEGNIRINVEEAEPISPIALLTSAEKHDITVSDNDAELCADGIGHMIIETNFITIK